MNFYDNVAPRYREMALARRLYLEAVDQVVVESLARKPVSHLLDVGAGDGIRLLHLMPAIPPTARVTALEPSSEMFAALVTNLPEATLRRATLEGCGFHGEFSHVIALWNVVGHASGLTQFLRAAHDALVPGGLLVFDFNSRNNLRAYGWRRVLANLAWTAGHWRKHEGRKFPLTGGAPTDFVSLYSLGEVKSVLSCVGLRVVSIAFRDYDTGTSRQSAWSGQVVVTAERSVVA